VHVMHATKASYALLVRPNGEFALLPWDTTPQHALGRADLHTVELTNQLTAWAEADTTGPGLQPNRPAAELLRLYQPQQPAAHGDVLFTGGTSRSGTVQGLNEDQAILILDRYLSRTPFFPYQRHR